MEQELIKKIRPHFEEYLKLVQKSENEFNKFLPAIAEEKKKEIQSKAQNELAAACDRLKKQIEEDIEKLKQKIFEKMYPKRSKIHLDVADITASGDRQFNNVYQILNYSRTSEQIKLALTHLVETKQTDAVFYLYQNIVATYQPIKASDEQRRMMAEIESIISKLKTDLGLSELETQINLRNSFLTNLKYFVSFLYKIELDKHIRTFDIMAVQFMRSIFPELYEYLMKRSYGDSYQKRVEA